MKKLKKSELRLLKIQIMVNKRQLKEIKQKSKGYKLSMSSYLLELHENNKDE